MRFVADLHIHSHLSRATSRDLTLEGLHRWAQLKGVTVVGTGDFTHPRWLAELREKLVPAEPGLFRLRPDLACAVDELVPPACRRPVRFALQVEISSIYKRADSRGEAKVRKVHNLVFAPDLEAAARIAGRLAALGNIESDGRPILGVDSRDLLAIVLESSPDGFLIPAHIWTPWFSALGAMSGFDLLADCYGDLADQIFAVETGLSSDPAMNWRLSQLDRYALISSSDAHSPEKLGREATLFDCELSYFAVRDALRSRTGLLGTVEFFPEEGKYHFDGHRKCGVVLPPAEARASGGLCPTCGKRLTGGVLARVEDLADRPAGHRPSGAAPFQSLIPLGEVIGEVVGVGPGSKEVRGAWERLLRRVGPELDVLMQAPIEDVARDAPPLLGEALRRMRAGDVHATPGYDGEYGVVRVFDEAERRALLAQRSFAFAAAAAQAAPAPQRARAIPAAARDLPAPIEGLNDEQRRAVTHGEGPLVIVAGPGTGKTRTVVERIAHLVQGGVSARGITAVSFTRKAAAELRDRLVARLGEAGRAIGTFTFHALGLELLRGHHPFTVLDETARMSLMDELLRAAPDDTLTAAAALEAISRAKGELRGPDDVPEARALYGAYEAALQARGVLDFDDLVLQAVRLLERDPEARAAAQDRARWLFVDEYQDVNVAQDRLVRLLAPPDARPNLCVVGDPDQAIYGFRGATPLCFARVVQDYPGAVTVTLTRSYRSPARIVAAATEVIARSAGRPPRPLIGVDDPAAPAVERHVVADATEEAELIAAEIERAVGGTSLSSFDSGRVDSAAAPAPLAFHDIAVLFRTSAQAAAIEAALDRAGIPHQRAGVDPLLARPAVARLVARLRGADLEGPIADRVRRLAADQVAESGAADLLAALALPYADDLAAFVDSLGLLRESDLRLAPQRVSLLTLHAAKGLEFALVVLAGCEQGVLPLWLPGAEVDVEEERRLLYVGMTRARRRLLLTAARRRNLFGRTWEPEPCPFLHDLAPGFVTDVIAARRRPRARQLSLGI